MDQIEGGPRNIEMTEDVKRSYDSTGRERQASENRERIARFAHDLFAENGFGNTTINDVAKAAGVSPQTIYKGFGNKAALLRSAFFVMFRGDEADVPLAERPEARAILALSDPLERLGALAALVTERNRRSAPLLATIKVAAETEPGARDLLEEWREWLVFAATRAAQAAALVGVALSEDDCRDIFYATMSGDLWQRLVIERGWTDARYAAWLAEFWIKQLA